MDSKMETGGASQLAKSSKRRRRRKNKSGLKPDNTKQTISENVPKTIDSKMETGGASQPTESVKRRRMHLRPSEIRYSQRSISCKFSDDTNIGSLLDDIMFERCLVSAVPVIKVSMIKNHWVSADNRRLCVFKQLEKLSRIETIKVKVVKKIYSGKLTSDNAGVTVVIRGILSGSVYVLLNEKFSDQCPMKRTVDPPTKSLQASDIADTDKSNIVQDDVFRNNDKISFQENISTDQYSSEYEYGECEYSECKECDEDNQNESSSDDTSANATDTDSYMSPNASVTDNGDTLSRDFSNLHLHQSSSTCHYFTGENNLYTTPRQTQTTSKSNYFFPTNELLSPRSEQAMNTNTAFQQYSLMASPNTDMNFLSGQGTSATDSYLNGSRNNSNSYGYIKRVDVRKPDILDSLFDDITTFRNFFKEIL